VAEACIFAVSREAHAGICGAAGLAARAGAIGCRRLGDSAMSSRAKRAIAQVWGEEMSHGVLGRVLSH